MERGPGEAACDAAICPGVAEFIRKMRKIRAYRNGEEADVVRLMSLGVLPAITIGLIAKSIVAKMLEGAIANWIAVRETAKQYHEFQRITEAGLRQLSTLLAQSTDTPEWEWFQMLKKMKEFGLLAPTPDPPPGPPQNQPGTGQDWMTWAVVAALVISVVFLSRKS